MNYTSIEQSKKLISLGLKPETAEMKFKYDFNEHTHKEKPSSVIIPNWDDPYNKDIPCWGAEDLLKQLPDDLKPYKHNSWELLSSYDKGFCLNYVDINGDMIHQTKCSSLIDACYETIVWVLENKY